MTADPGAKTIMAGIGNTGAAPAPSMPPARPTAPPMAAAPPMAMPVAPPRASLAAPDPAEKKPRSSVPSEKMAPQGPPVVRPRVVSMEKPTEAARQALRQAADVGDYLNTLLTQGLLNVPAVQARIEPVTTKPAKRWGRSAVRTFVFLFALLAVGLGGGGYWVYRAELQRKEEVEGRLARTDAFLETSTYADVQSALAEIAGALERDPNNLVAMAKFSRVGAVSALLYGMAPSKASAAMSRARAGIQPGQPGWPDIAFAQAALTMATLGDETEGSSGDRLSDTRSGIDGWLAEHPGDGWMQWLKGLAQLETGDLSGAAQSFEAAEAGGKGPVIATIYRADLQLDSGDLEGSMARYEQALARAKNHPLAVLGKALARIDRADDPADILGEINNTLDEELGPRVSAYRALAFAMSYLWLGWDYDQFNENLAKTDGVREPRFLARVALSELANGRLTAASETRNRIVWFSKEPKEKHPLVAAVDAHVQWLTGLSGPALEVVKDVQSMRARHMRGRALYELGRMDEALAELAGILELAPEDWEAQTWHTAARMITESGAERQKADDELKKLGRVQASKLVRYVHGTAWLRIGNKREARLRFEDSLEDLTKERPNPVAERSHTALAELDLAENKLDAAKAHLDEAVEINPGYLPALGLLGRVQLLRGQYGEAAATLRPLMDEPELASATLDLAFAEALVGGGNADDQARQQARAVVLRAKGKGASAEELARVGALVGPELLEELGIQPKRGGGGGGRPRGRPRGR
jgi:tetratricopeptide (TPR) repeat protein